MTSGMKTIIFPVADLGQAKALYTALLGSGPYLDMPYYAGFRAAGQEIGLDPNGHRHGTPGPVCYWHVADIEASLQALLAAGAQVEQEVKDVGGGKLTASVKDQDGNVVGILQEP